MRAVFSRIYPNAPEWNFLVFTSITKNIVVQTLDKHYYSNRSISMFLFALNKVRNFSGLPRQHDFSSRLANTPNQSCMRDVDPKIPSDIYRRGGAIFKNFPRLRNFYSPRSGLLLVYIEQLVKKYACNLQFMLYLVARLTKPRCTKTSLHKTQKNNFIKKFSLFKKRLVPNPISRTSEHSFFVQNLNIWRWIMKVCVFYSLLKNSYVCTIPHKNVLLCELGEGHFAAQLHMQTTLVFV